MFMGLMCHLDKAVFLAILAFAVWYVVHGFQDLKGIRVEQEQQISAAKELSEKVSRNVIPPPEADADAYSGVAKKRWEVAPATMDLVAWHFYPSALEPKRKP
jgi:hypothetical protein